MLICLLELDRYPMNNLEPVEEDDYLVKDNQVLLKLQLKKVAWMQFFRQVYAVHLHLRH